MIMAKKCEKELDEFVKKYRNSTLLLSNYFNRTI